MSDSRQRRNGSILGTFSFDSLRCQKFETFDFQDQTQIKSEGYLEEEKVNI